ncbi:MAG: manganese efflux pump MntP family protein [Syntrophales bacterium]|jgi:manganese efflux pump family protein
MSFLSILVIAIGLGMDAFSVAIGVGASIKARSWGSILRLSSYFGLFQFLMPVVGWFAGVSVANIIAGYDHWIAFGLLTLVGGRMIIESYTGEAKVLARDQTRGLTVIMLSLATSIDALAVGFSFALLQMPVFYPSIIIGMVAFMMTMLGMLFGEKLGVIFGRRAGVFGGLLLIGIGLIILMGHMA